MTVDGYDGAEYDSDDLIEDLGLPDRLPALLVPPVAELASAARESELMRRVSALAAWVGERHAVSQDGDLTEQDAADAAAKLGLEPVEVLLCWEAALATDLVVVTEDWQAEGNPDLWPTGDDREDLGTWSAALPQVFVSLDLDAELVGEPDLAFDLLGSLMIPLFVVRNSGIPLAELRLMVHDLVTEGLPDDTAWDAWVTAHGDPTDTLLTRLAGHAAVVVEDDAVSLTPPALLAMREELVEAGVEIPLLPPLPEMTAEQLLSAVGGLTEDELASLTEAWLAERPPLDAARALLSAAVDVDPEARLHATAILSGIDGTPWETVLDEQSLRPYALAALGRERTPAETAWRMLDVLGAAAETSESVEPLFSSVVPGGQEQDVLAAAWRLPHPDTFEVLTLVGAHHPDKQVAKAARTAAHKARSAS